MTHRHVDETILIDGGAHQERRSFLAPDGSVAALVVKPYPGPLVPGCRVRHHDDDYGIGWIPDDGGGIEMAMFVSAQNALFVGPAEGRAERLPERIEASVLDSAGHWHGVDITTTVLAMAARDIRALRDGPVPDFVRKAYRGRRHAAGVDMVSAISHYFGLQPDFDGTLMVSHRLTETDITQAIGALMGLSLGVRKIEVPSVDDTSDAPAALVTMSV